jgi:hypothetical protein
MKKLRFLLGFMLLTVGVYAQQSLVVFMEATEKRPFYVKLGSKTIASSATGQALITELSDSSYQVTIGFPGTDMAELPFLVKLHKNDNSFQLKQGSDQLWSLVDLESSQVLKPEQQLITKPVYAQGGVRKTDPFAVMMAAVVNDTSVLYTSVINRERESPVKTTANPVVTPAKDQNALTAVADAPRQSVPVTLPDSASKRNDSSLAVLKRVGNNQNDSSLLLKNKSDSSTEDAALKINNIAGGKPGDTARKIDNPDRVDSSVVVTAVTAKQTEASKAPAVVASNTADSARSAGNAGVRPLVNNNKSEAETVVVDSVSARKEIPVSMAAGRVEKISEIRQDKELIVTYTDRSPDGKTDTIRLSLPAESVPVSSMPKKDSIWGAWDKTAKASNNNPATLDTARKLVPMASKPPVAEKKAPVMINSDCVNFATEYDLDKLRVKMIADVTADERVASAKKVFRTKCFSSRQIRALSELFLNDEGKYKFLDAAYPFVSDTEAFKQLADLLKDDYYIKRFNAMIRS